MTEEIRNAYQMLELPDGTNLPQIQKAWREMVTVWHPDRFPNNPDLQRKAEERTKQINNAYDILKRYLINGDIPRSRPRPSTQSQKQESQKRTRQPRSRSSKQSRKQESQKQTRQPRSRSSKQSRKQESQKQTRQPRSRSSKQSRKQESQKRTRQQETASEDAQSSQTYEEENRQKQTPKPKKEKSPAAKNGEIIGAIIFGAIGGYFVGGVIGSLPFVLDWMIEAVSGWSFIDGANPWRETFPSKTLIIVPLIVTFLSRIISAMLAENERKLIGSDEDWYWFASTFLGGFVGTIGGIIGSGMGDTGIFIGAFLGTFLGTRLACSIFSEDES